MNETDFLNYMRGFAAALGDDRPSRNQWDSLVNTMNAVGRDPKDNSIRAGVSLFGYTDSAGNYVKVDTGIYYPFSPSGVFYPVSSTGEVKDNFYSIYGDKYGMENPNAGFQSYTC